METQFETLDQLADYLNEHHSDDYPADLIEKAVESIPFAIYCDDSGQLVHDDVVAYIPPDDGLSTYKVLAIVDGGNYAVREWYSGSVFKL